MGESWLRRLVTIGITFPIETTSNGLSELRVRTEELTKLEQERNEVMRKLLLEREQLVAIFNSIEEPLQVSELGTHKVLFANKSFIELVGEDPIGKPCYMLMCNVEAPPASCPFADPAVDGKSVNQEYFNEKFQKQFKCMGKLIDWPVQSGTVKAIFELCVTESIQL